MVFGVVECDRPCLLGLGLDVRYRMKG